MATLSPSDYWASQRAAKQARVDEGKSAGFQYTDWPHRQAAVWFDQIFASLQRPTGTIAATQALRIGTVPGKMDVALICSGANTADLTFPAGAAFECTCKGCETEDGTFVEFYKASITLTNELKASPAGIIARFALPESCPKFVKADVKITGNASGTGTVDTVLVFNVH